MIRKRKEYFTAFLLILPSLIGIAVFYVIPYIICFIKSLYIGQNFVGLTNYIQLFSNNTFLLALKNTAVFTVIAIPLLMMVSFLLALFLNSFEKISSFFRSAFLIPVVVPVASLICVWQVVFDDYGAINGLLNTLGFDNVELASLVTPELTTVAQPIDEMGGKAVELIINGNGDGPNTYIYPISLKIRETTKQKII